MGLVSKTIFPRAKLYHDGIVVRRRVPDAGSVRQRLIALLDCQDIRHMREAHRRTGIRRDAHGEFKPVIGELPAGSDLAVLCVESDARKRQPSAGLWLNQDVFVAGLRWIGSRSVTTEYIKSPIAP